jgi:hypothetical protein
VLDLVRSKQHDLADEGIWNEIRQDIVGGKYHGGGNAPPCSTFCGNRGYGPGPRVLRGVAPPELYGLANLRPEEKEAVRTGTCLALRDTKV